MKKFQAIILFFFLMGCSANPAIPPTTTPYIPITYTPPPTATKTPRIKPTKTITPTSPPTVASSPIWTPFPTYSITDGKRILRNSIMGSLDCLLPCWGGVTPGITNWQQARQLLEPLSSVSTLTISENTECDFGHCNTINWSLAPDTRAKGTFYTDSPEGLIRFIDIDIRNSGANRTDYTRDLRMRSIFRFYGLPDFMVFRGNNLTSQENNKTLEIAFVYPKRHFMIIYWKNAKINGDKAVSCRGYVRVKVLILDNEESLKSLDAIATAVETKGLDINKGYKTTQEAIGMTNGAFYEYFSKQREPCISTPINIWSP